MWNGGAGPGLTWKGGSVLAEAGRFGMQHWTWGIYGMRARARAHPPGARCPAPLLGPRTEGLSEDPADYSPQGLAHVQSSLCLLLG